MNELRSARTVSLELREISESIEHQHPHLHPLLASNPIYSDNPSSTFPLIDSLKNL